MSIEILNEYDNYQLGEFVMCKKTIGSWNEGSVYKVTEIKKMINRERDIDVKISLDGIHCENMNQEYFYSLKNKNKK